MTDTQVHSNSSAQSRPLNQEAPRPGQRAAGTKTSMSVARPRGVLRPRKDRGLLRGTDGLQKCQRATSTPHRSTVWTPPSLAAKAAKLPQSSGWQHGPCSIKVPDLPASQAGIQSQPHVPPLPRPPLCRFLSPPQPPYTSRPHPPLSSPAVLVSLQLPNHTTNGPHNKASLPDDCSPEVSSDVH